MKEKIFLYAAVGLALSNEHHSPVVGLYDIARTSWRLCQEGQYAGREIRNLPRKMPLRSNILVYKRKLLEHGMLEQHKHSPALLLTAFPYKTAEDIACGLDRFCYLSHLSAMAFHGLTERSPKIVFVTTLSSALWKQAALNVMRNDLGEKGLQSFIDADLPLLTRHVADRIAGKAVNVYSSKHAGSYIVKNSGALRVASIGRVFLDMLRKPDLCGGMGHVAEVFEAHASFYLPLILDELERHGSPIEKVRAGYLLEERCGIEHERIHAWTVFAQRGGSRKLDPDNEYWPQFSEKWCLSINIGL